MVMLVVKSPTTFLLVSKLRHVWMRPRLPGPEKAAIGTLDKPEQRSHWLQLPHAPRTAAASPGVLPPPSELCTSSISETTPITHFDLVKIKTQKSQQHRPLDNTQSPCILTCYYLLLTITHSSSQLLLHSYSYSSL